MMKRCSFDITFDVLVEDGLWFDAILTPIFDATIGNGLTPNLLAIRVKFYTKWMFLHQFSVPLEALYTKFGRKILQ